MGKTSDELREWVRRARADEHMDLRELDAIADRIDSEMAELPRDRDGKPIHVGDILRDYDGNEDMQAEALRFDGRWEIRTYDGYTQPFWCVHTSQDSWERIADDIEASKGTVLISEETLGDWADRIRKLAEKEGE